MKLLQLFEYPYIKGYFTASGVFRTDDIKTGNIIGYVGSSSSATYFPKTVTNSNDETYSIYNVDYLGNKKDFIKIKSNQVK